MRSITLCLLSVCLLFQFSARTQSDNSLGLSLNTTLSTFDPFTRFPYYSIRPKALVDFGISADRFRADRRLLHGFAVSASYRRVHPLTHFPISSEVVGLRLGYEFSVKVSDRIFDGLYIGLGSELIGYNTWRERDGPDNTTDTSFFIHTVASHYTAFQALLNFGKNDRYYFKIKTKLGIQRNGLIISEGKGIINNFGDDAYPLADISLGLGIRLGK